MNFLAHAYLSFGDADILIGNMIADMVKGRQIEQYCDGIRHGITIHRHIDTFTDSHPVTLQAMEFFRASAHKYAGAFLDVAYDHFLALDVNNEPKEGWKDFAEKCYEQISKYADILPAKFCNMFMYMRSEDWFYNYRYHWMIERSFTRLQQRAAYLPEDSHMLIYSDFEKHYDEIKESYALFFPELKAYAYNLYLQKGI
ncbi:ACP phosphodiesterase [Prevotella sp. 10(H)]|uniref:acyl carrier protein phosphodiesterase n=1 Tax=Prevotella sp. 10(H) TaxID=1158294 RepID=UPI0004A6D15E|nr:ACP phosphodiesterase [Prevotella sp. 10(H)]